MQLNSETVKNGLWQPNFLANFLGGLTLTFMPAINLGEIRNERVSQQLVKQRFAVSTPTHSNFMLASFDYHIFCSRSSVSHSLIFGTHTQNETEIERKIDGESGVCVCVCVREDDIGASNFVCARARLHLILLTTAIIITLTLNLYALNDYCSVVVPFMDAQFSHRVCRMLNTYIWWCIFVLSAVLRNEPWIRSGREKA